jgi:hypothetical protein
MRALLYTCLSASTAMATAVPSVDRTVVLPVIGWVLLVLYICGSMHTVVTLLRYPADDEARLFVVISIFLVTVIPLLDLWIIASWKLLSEVPAFSGFFTLLLWIKNRVENGSWEEDSAEISNSVNIAQFDTAEAAERAAWMLKGKRINETQVELPDFNANAQALDAVASTIGSSWSWAKSTS